MDFLCFYFPLFCIHWLISNNIFIEYNTQRIIYCANKKQDKILLLIILAL